MFGHVTTQRVWLFVLCCVHRADVQLGEVRDFMTRLLVAGIQHSAPAAVCRFCEHYIPQLTCSMLRVCVCVCINTYTYIYSLYTSDLQTYQFHPT